MSVSRYSKVPDAAIQLVRYFTSPEFQTWRAQAASVVPTIQAVADKPEVQAVEPYLKTMADVDRVGRPSAEFGDNYNQASTAFFQGVSQVLAGQDATQALPDMQSKLQRLLS
jgi:trehalose/maltose transport system substrate-binding protein